MTWFGKTLWPGLAVCGFLYCLDYYLTIACARLYRAGAQEKIAFEGSYEITPYYQRDVDRLRLFSPRFALAFVWVLIVLSAAWWLTMEAGIPEMYPLLLGVFVGLELAVQKRHLQNLFLLFTITKPGAVRGRIEYSRGFALQQSAVSMFTSGAVFAVLYLFTWSLFVLGGAVACLLTAVRHWSLARRHVLKAAAASSPQG